MRQLLNAVAAMAVLSAVSLTASADHHTKSCCKPAPKCCQPQRACGLFSLPKLKLPKLELPKLDLFGCLQKSSACCKPVAAKCSGGKSEGEEVKAPKVEDAPPPPYEEKAPKPAPAEEDAKAEPAKKA